MKNYENPKITSIRKSSQKTSKNRKNKIEAGNSSQISQWSVYISSQTLASINKSLNPYTL